MRNLNVYSEDAFKFYQDCIKRKNLNKDDPDYKNRLALLESGISARYELYNEKFQANQLETIGKTNFELNESKDLLSLYRYKAKLLTDLRIKITTLKNNRVHNECQNCTIGEIGSLDHYLPKDLFPDFAIHPKNLVPSCSKCNGYKGIKWEDAGKRLFINPYLDKLPALQYLFVDIKVNDNRDLDIGFNVDNRNGITDNLFDIIESHYSKLELCSRFSENCERAISEVEIELEKYSKKLPIAEVRQTIIETAEEQRMIFGYNHYFYILQIALAENDNFITKYVGLTL
jgi:5-methylcytosine-specific restriction endonuclease McrA